ncbi:MAG: NAD+ synthase [Thermoanaerobaculia bacterium]|nr:NAD+ synthase [Thermoanaerobaculia bacterium]
MTEGTWRDGLDINPELAVTALTGFIRDAVATARQDGVVVGLSGGIDSALSTGLAALALGPERVHALMMPYRTSSPDSATDAETVAEKFGLAPRTVDITPMVDGYFDANDPEADTVRRGNLMARARMAVLFDLAKKLRCLVLGTSNKTEILLGYSTIFGDNASSINPLGDLFKCQVVSLARHIGVPDAVIDKKPSADLWPGQTDEEELGFDYGVADEVLYLMFNLGLQVEEVVELGYEPEVVARIDRLERAFRFKRRLMLIARLSGSAINLDREIPRD